MATILSHMLLMTIPVIVIGQNNPTVRTRMGEVRGILENNVNQFRNIPYAKPPVGPLRFAKSVPSDPWTTVRDGTQFGPSCLQPPYPETDKFLPNLNKSEDCLYLNVYVPGSVVAGSNKPVMVWIHGGAFLVGQAMLYDASFLAKTGDVIVVTVNYRLGVFGFLSTMDSILPGNYGLWDQRLALQWVKTNIAEFGGNPSSVTLFGESAGSISVSLQSINPMNRGLFQRVIAESGVSLSNIAVWDNSSSFARDVGVSLNCSSTTGKLDDAYVRCMRSIPAAKLLNTQNVALFMQSDNFGPVLHPIIGPVIDHTLITDSPYKLLSNTSSPSFQFFRSLDYMAGNVNQEGSLFLERLAKIGKSKNFDFKTGVPTSVFCNYLVPIFTATFEAVSSRTISPASACSTYGRSDVAAQASSVLDCFADVNFVVPAIESLGIHSAGNILTSTYQYMFNRPSIDTPSLQSLPHWFVGAPHASEVFFLFGAQELKSKFNITVSAADMALSQRMMTHWTNFAKIGNPNMNNNPMWIPYDISQRFYMDFNSNVTLKSHLYKARVSLWLGDQSDLLSALQSVIVGRGTE
ncbi:liver carboxylesterase 1-like [Mizuhopecten yessoensis]|uniref:Carboxylic ester hydrolase n=1 Tax=Mizuhopecten yessoensis TaxID=6573 RepID=A0A210PUL3_MIZYE|nr:liver carboxylesterase 1-like [Mizuhopecten yessoensis]OWF40145.1 Liver carboxylesterase 1 [Mizuhopecten yessoensis]